MSLTRALTVYVAQGFVCFFFIFLAYKILKRDRKRLNLIFSGFYLSAAIGLLINFIYAPLDPNSLEIVPVIIFLNFITNFGIFYSPIFIVIFDLILLKSEKIITPIKQLAILILYGIAMFSMIFFAYVKGIAFDGSSRLGVEFDPLSWSPIWNLPFFLYLLIIESIPTGLILYFSFQIYKKFEDEQLRKKWKFFIFGIIALIIFMYGIFVSNYLNDPTIRLGMGALGLILAVVGGYMMYTGVGRQLEQ